MEFWTRLKQFIEKFEDYAFMKNPKESEEFFYTWELEMAKALLTDCTDGAVRVSKIILALKDVGDIKIKID